MTILQRTKILTNDNLTKTNFLTEKTNSLIQDLMEMVKKQVKP